MKKIKEWFADLPFSVAFFAVMAVMAFIYVRKLFTGQNAISDLAVLVGPVEESWINGVAEGIEALSTAL